MHVNHFVLVDLGGGGGMTQQEARVDKFVSSQLEVLKWVRGQPGYMAGL